jgi:hypothetical protein
LEKKEAGVEASTMTRDRLASGVAVLAVVAFVATAILLAMPTGAKQEPPDWASIWTMRWTALASLAGIVSMVAIIVTAFYAARAIETTSTIEKTKRTADLIAAFHSRNIVDASIRALVTEVGNYELAKVQLDFNAIAGFLEECAVMFFSGLLDQEIFLNRLDFAVNNSWLVVHYRLVPELQRLGAWTDVVQSDKLRAVCYAHLLRRVPRETRAKIVAEEDRYKALETRVRTAPSTKDSPAATGR